MFISAVVSRMTAKASCPIRLTTSRPTGQVEQGYQLALTPREYFAAGIVAAPVRVEETDLATIPRPIERAPATY